MAVLTKRQWKILQVGLLALDSDLGKDAGFLEHDDRDKGVGFWDTDDGPAPSPDEIAALAEVVGRMPHDGNDSPPEGEHGGVPQPG